MQCDALATAISPISCCYPRVTHQEYLCLGPQRRRGSVQSTEWMFPGHALVLDDNGGPRISLRWPGIPRFSRFAVVPAKIHWDSRPMNVAYKGCDSVVQAEAILLMKCRMPNLDSARTTEIVIRVNKLRGRHSSFLVTGNETSCHMIQAITLSSCENTNQDLTKLIASVGSPSRNECSIP